MKCIILACVLLSNFDLLKTAPTINKSQEYEQDMKRRELMGLECLKETNVDKTILDRAVKKLEFVDNQQYKDFLACSYKKQGYQDEDGNILYDNIKEFLNRFYNLSELKMIDTCKNTTGSTHGDLAFNAMKCVIRKLQEIEANQENKENSA